MVSLVRYLAEVNHLRMFSGCTKGIVIRTLRGLAGAFGLVDLAWMSATRAAGFTAASAFADASFFGGE